MTNSKPIVPALAALNTAILLIVTGSESEPLAVKVAVAVHVDVPPVWA